MKVSGGVRSFFCLVLGLALLGGAWASTTAGASAREQSTPGTLKIAAEQEPGCMDWIGSCAGASWGIWAAGIETLPQALTVTPAGDYTPSSVLAGEPILEIGPPQKITYNINAAAVWSDNTPITSTDFEYTWKQIATGKDIYDKTGYEDIASIDTTDPKVAVVTFSEPFSGWRDLFGGFSFILPSHLLEGKNRAKIMKDGYSFSGGPWKLEGGKSGWKKTKSITLVPNQNYWGDKPLIGKVIFQFITESASEIQAVKSGQVSSAYPQPQIGALDQLSENPELKYEVSFGSVFEAFWLNAKAFPMDSLAVRKSLIYATDRQAIVDEIVKPSVNEGRVLQSFIVPTFPQYYEPAFSIYGTSANLSKVNELMTADGWKKGSDGIWAKGGRKAEFDVQTTAGNEARELTEQLWQSQLTQAGFKVTIKNPSADVLFGINGPKGRFAAALYAQVGTPDPSLCGIFCSANIPTKKNGFVGNNWTRLTSAAIDTPWTAVDAELDATARTISVKEGQNALAAEAVSIPLYQKPNIFVWNTAQIGGPLQDNPTLGPFFNLNLWYLK